MASRPVGSVPLGAHEDEKTGGGLLKKLLPLLLLLAIIIVALVLLVGGDDKKSSSASSTASLKAAGTTLLPVKAGGLKPAVGETFTGSGVKVVSVNADKGFFVGTSPQNRVYVEFGGSVGENESGKMPAVGDTVTLQGEVRPSPQDPASALNLEPDDAALVKREGGFLNASSVK